MTDILGVAISLTDAAQSGALTMVLDTGLEELDKKSASQQ